MKQWSGQLTLAPRCPDYVDALVLSAGVAKSVTVPAGASWVLFSCSTGADFYVSYGGTATIPSNDITDGTGCEMNPGARFIGGVASISVISPSAMKITMAFFA